ncbi:aromatic ring-hydroxylating dioxygenase subunit alpha [Pseudomaricurvus alkylphenolicus]|uniref:aromatic ring-hydroxylating oxygenase subunit alpha n=1 Tax=Pseudomaricurvus alkylphenolicus TaxID=1306991 RepID=UPI0014243F26|nr:aromatic ring-hydroxylating dioxygenase subunit alpha [Pseudomaricurvus alkylphenolicus]NIB44682.1 aromatic ring-hydroxylating dioxygenase subunit alpha [Pseudomaricurvus alkylphenolicus]
MKREKELEIIDTLLDQIENDYNADAGVQTRMSTEAYTCPKIAEQEQDLFFRNTPQLIGLSGRLPEPNSFFTTDHFGVPVLATRDKDGQFHAFLNICPHRAVRLTDEKSGKQSRFSCPFHAWNFSNQGDLVAVPREKDFGKVDKKCNSLTPLPAEERNGMLWVHPQPDGVLDLNEFLGPLSEELADTESGRLVYVGENTIEGDLNWKLANDTFGESYHFSVLHKNTLANLFHGNNSHFEEFGQHHRFIFAAKTILPVTQQSPRSEWKLSDTAIVLYYLFPNIQLQISPGTGMTVLSKMYPVEGNPNKSVTHNCIYMTPEALEMLNAARQEGQAVMDDTNLYSADMDAVATGETAASVEAALEAFKSTIEDEDYLMGKMQQKNARSGLVKDLIFGRNEHSLQHHHKTFRKALGMPPLEEIKEDITEKSQDKESTGEVA